LSALRGILPVVTVRDSDSELVRGEKPLVSKSGQLLVKLWECIREERLSNVSVWLFQGGITDTLGLPTVDITEHGWVFATRPAQTNLIVIQGDHENRVDPSTTAIGVGTLEEILVRAFGVIDDDDL
jgi:hypothetical protein